MNLFHHNVEDSDEDSAADPLWNWPILEQYLQPGADLAFFDAEDVEALCPEVGDIPRLESEGQEIEYVIDWQGLFECASELGLFTEQISGSEIPILSIAWANEGLGEDGWLWTSYHAMEMISAADLQVDEDDEDDEQDDDDD